MAYTTRFGKVVRKNDNRAYGGQRTSAQAPAFKADKGEEGGSCNRTSCQRPGADWYNHSTRKFYCEDCAHWLNTDTFNRRDAMALYGHDLCTLGRPVERNN